MKDKQACVHRMEFKVSLHTKVALGKVLIYVGDIKNIASWEFKIRVVALGYQCHSGCGGKDMLPPELGEEEEGKK